MKSKYSVGDTFKVPKGSTFVIEEYIKWDRVRVRSIDTGYTTITNTSLITRKEIKDLLVPELHGIGIVGEKYKPKDHKDAYTKWSSILRKHVNELDSYKNKGIVCCEEWFKFENFVDWYTSQYMADGMDYDIDKDLKYIGNTVYSPETCWLIPAPINRWLTVSNISANIEQNKNGSIFRARGTSCGGRYDRKFNCVEDARMFKIEQIKNNFLYLADKYREFISDDIYNRLVHLSNSDEVFDF